MNQIKNNHWYWVISVLAVLLVVIFVFVGMFQYSRAWDRGWFLTPLYRLDTEEKMVALTFDDGPSAEKTEKLLDLLAQYQVKATFFMLGEKIEKYPDVVRRVHEDGHLIGNHSYDHARLIFKMPGYISEEIKQTDDLILGLGQSEVKYFRPPYSSKFIILPLVLRSMDKILVTGTYDPPAEYNDPLDGEEMAREVLDNVSPGAIIYLHDGNDKNIEEFINGVEKIIVELNQKGYSLVRLDQVE